MADSRNRRNFGDLTWRQVSRVLVCLRARKGFTLGNVFPVIWGSWWLWEAVIHAGPDLLLQLNSEEDPSDHQKLCWTQFIGALWCVHIEYRVHILHSEPHHPLDELGRREGKSVSPNMCVLERCEGVAINVRKSGIRFRIEPHGRVKKIVQNL